MRSSRALTHARFKEYPLGFWEESDHTINFDAITNLQLIHRIQSGRGESPLYESYDPHYIPIHSIFSGRMPKDLTTKEDGSNNIYYFEALQIEYTFHVDEDDEDDINSWLDDLEELVEDISDDSDFIDAYFYSLDRIEKNLWDGVSIDLGLYFAFLAIIFIYSLFMIGRCHPLYCRLPLTVSMLISYLMTLFMSYGFPSYIGLPIVSSSGVLSLLLAFQTIHITAYLVRSVENIKILVMSI